MCGSCAHVARDLQWYDFVLLRGEREKAVAHRHRLVQALQTVLREFGISVSGSQQGSGYVVSNQKGASEVVDDLDHLWAAAERLARREIRILSDEFRHDQRAGHTGLGPGGA